MSARQKRLEVLRMRKAVCCVREALMKDTQSAGAAQAAAAPAYDRPDPFLRAE